LVRIMLPSPAGDERHEQQDQKWYQRYQILLFVGVTALFVLAVGLILDWYIDPQNSTQKMDLVQALGLITAWWLGPSASSSLGAANGSPEKHRRRASGTPKLNSRTLRRNCGSLDKGYTRL
jgi:hypothetical protein